MARLSAKPIAACLLVEYVAEPIWFSSPAADTVWRK
jgi:hypothetical protein